MSLLGHITETPWLAQQVSAPSAVQALGDEAQALAMAGLITGLVLWLIGGRVLRPAFSVLGMALGAFLGVVLLPLTGMEPIPTNWEALPTLSPEQLGLVGGGLLGLVLSITLYRVAMAIGAGLVFAGVGVLAGLVYIQDAPPAADPEGADDAFVDTTDDTTDDTDAQAAVDLEQMVRTSALEQARSWTESRGQEAIDEGLESAEAAGYDVSQARAQLANAAERSSAFLSQSVSSIQAYWETLQVRHRLLLIGTSVAGLAVGLLFGLVAPNRSAALISAMGGSAVLMGCALALTDSYGLSSEWVMSQPAPTWAIVWGVVTAIGLTFQIAVVGRKGKRDEADDED